MYNLLTETIRDILATPIVDNERQRALQPLVDFIQQKVTHGEAVNLNFICTHNSRRSHLSQVWAQVAAAHFAVPNVHCYSGGTEATALFPKVAETLTAQGFEVFKISEATNPVYAIKYRDDTAPIIGFSKTYDSAFNPGSGFAAIMTCSQADAGCPFVPGAERRITVTFEDPKVSDGTPDQTRVYAERSLQIAGEMFYVFSRIVK